MTKEPNDDSQVSDDPETSSSVENGEVTTTHADIGRNIHHNDSHRRSTSNNESNGDTTRTTGPNATSEMSTDKEGEVPPGSELSRSHTIPFNPSFELCGPIDHRAPKKGIKLFNDEDPSVKDPTQEMLLWHYRLGHLPFKIIQAIARSRLLPSRLGKCRVPECAACRLGAATKVPHRYKGETNKGKLQQATKPGAVVSVDQLEATTPGLVAQLKGIPTVQRYKYATVFVDHFSDLSFVFMMKHLTSEETLLAKKAFEAYSRAKGVRILHYHCDNGRFSNTAFIQDVERKGQTISYCGVNAHFQNGCTEKCIRDLQQRARVSLLHAKQRWPSAIETSLWPYAIRYVNEVRNTTVQVEKQQSPIELFTSVPVRPKLRHYHPFGCPVYVLRNELQGGKTLPKWDRRSRVGLYLGVSPRHSRSVALVLNLHTSLVSPQYHLKFDNLFETLEQIQPVHSLWQEKCHFKSIIHGKSKKFMDSVRRATAKLSGKSDEVSEIPAGFQVTGASGGTSTQSSTTTTGDAETHESHENHDQTHHYHRSPDHADLPENDDASSRVTVESSTQDAENNELIEGTPANNDEPAPTGHVTTTRSGRVVKPTQRAIESNLLRQSGVVSYRAEYEAIDPDLYREDDLLQDLDDPIAYAMKASNDPDTLYINEALRADDAEEFKKAMVKEVKDHTEKGHWRIVKKKALPQGQKLLPAVWAMRRKRRIATREVYKWKSRLNLGGHKMVPGINYIPGETYAPTLSWEVIRLFLNLCVTKNWKSRQLDFILAYPQALIAQPTYMELPKGIKFPAGIQRNKHCLEVVQNIYGGKNSGRTWYKHLAARLEDIGFQKLNNDDCVFFRHNTVILVYTDDCLVFAPSKAEIDECYKDLTSKFDVEDEGTIEDYLGVKISRTGDNKWELTQPQLIDSILSDLGLLGGNDPASTCTTPTVSSKLIGPDPDGLEFSYLWDYRSVIGKLNFLEKTTRPNISYAVHQCARFMQHPKQSHGEAIKHIGRYLLEMRGKGIIVSPDESMGFECYVDADFAGNWDQAIAAEDPATAKSRTGYIIKYYGTPITWASKLQTQFALSLAESKFLALSTATRHVKYLMYLLQEINEKITTVSTKPVIKCKVFEDNSAALEIARVPKMRPRTRHINVAYHHFTAEVANKRLTLLPINTIDQQADIMTKGVGLQILLPLRKRIMGW